MKTKKEWLVAVILTFITFCAWIVFDLIHTRQTVEINPEVQQQLEPINPNFDTSFLN